MAIKNDYNNKSDYSSKNYKSQERFANPNADDVEVGTDTWLPTPAVLEGFFKRDFVLCGRNMQMVLENARMPLSFREVKEQLLHSVDVIERVITSKIASGHLFEAKGKYSLSRV